MDQRYQKVKEDADRLANRHAYLFVKRLFDIVFSLLVFVLLGWLFVLVAIAIKIDNPHAPVFFKQQRVGAMGKPFYMFKFRSMCVDAEQQRDALAELNERDGPAFKIKDDPRVTRVGRFIRRVSIDELPQFANVFLGQMSVVGPRPALPSEIAQYTEYQRLRLLIKPGITCFWQADPHRDDLTFDEWVASDLRYLEECGVLCDLRIILGTVRSVAMGS